MINSLIVLASEATLALYPILIKTVDVGLTTQLLTRFLTFTVMGLLLSKSGTLSQLYGSTSTAARTLMLGGITLAHVFTSYFAFDALPAGVAMSLFYTYPIWNIVGGYLGYGETVSITQILFIGLALIGVVLLSLGTKEESVEGEKKEIEWKGIAAGLGAAITETLMYFAVRTAHISNPYFSTVELYSGALLGMVALILGGAAMGGRVASLFKVEGGAGAWSKMLLFNSIIGFAGYALRFYAIPKLSTVVFSMLSLVGVIASFVWGILFVSEVPTSMNLLGAGMIAAAAAFTDRKE